MSKIYKGAIELIGNTPLVEVTNIEKKLGLKATILVKLEYFNPAGSVKDRIAKAMIEDAEAKGLLHEGSVIIEPTSGNTGIGLAAIAAAMTAAISSSSSAVCADAAAAFMAFLFARRPAAAAFAILI